MAERQDEQKAPLGRDAVQRMIREAQSKPPHDATAEIERASQGALRHPGEEKAFIRSKLRLLDGDKPIRQETRIAWREHLERLLRGRAEPTPPPPGGYGYCTLFTSVFRAAFQTGTAIQYFVVCPTTPGGNVDDFLYLTAMNRASKGLEVHPLYYKQNRMSLRVWDWAPGHENEQRLIPFEQLDEYLFTLEDPPGSVNQVMFVVNMSYQVSPTDWGNVAFLLNYRKTRYDLIYQFYYPSSTAEQQAGWIGSWGPDVETFQAHYSNTNVMGFLEASLASRSDATGAWAPSGWQNLVASQATVRSDNLGFVPVRVDPYYNILVKGGA